MKKCKKKRIRLDDDGNLKIAESSHNPVHFELIKFMTPNIVFYCRNFFRDSVIITVPIHEQILDAVAAGNGEKAAARKRTALQKRA